MSKIVSTLDLIMINKRAVSQKLSNTLSNSALDKLDDDGIHVVGTNMLHEGGGRISVRCHMLLKFKGDDQPHFAWLDMPTDDFNRLVDHVAV